MAANLPQLPATKRLSPRVLRILGDNPSKFTLQGTNTYLIGTGSSRILIDTAEGRPQWRESLRSVLESEKCSISTALITHWHQDHVGGVEDLLALSPGAKIHKNTNTFATEGWEDIHDGQTFQVEGAEVRALFCPGHTADHMAFILADEDALFTGDNVLGHGTAVFEDLGEYLQSLEGMSTVFKGRAYPAHGEVIDDGPAKVREYISHRKEREQQVLAVLESEKKPWRSMEIVKVIYKDYPESLHAPAEKGLLLILEKLRGDGTVSEKDDGSWTLASKAAL